MKKPRLARRTKDLLEEARKNEGLNRTELALLLSKKGKVPYLWDTQTPEEMWAAYDTGVPAPDPLWTTRWRLHTFVKTNYPRISAYMVCPARVEGPSACVTCPGRLLVTCYLDNHDLLGDEELMGNQAELLALVREAKNFGLLPRVGLKIPIEQLKNIVGAFNDGSLPSLETVSDIQDKINTIPNGDLPEGAVALIEELLNASGGKAPTKKKRATKKKAVTKKAVTKKAAPVEDATITVATGPTATSNGGGAPVVDLTQVTDYLGGLKGQLSEFIGNQRTLSSQLDAITQQNAALMAVARQRTAQVRFVGDAVTELVGFLAGDDAKNEALQTWGQVRGIEVSQQEIESLETLGDDELVEIAKTTGAPSTVLASRAGMLGWISAQGS